MALVQFDLERELKPFDREAALKRTNPFRHLDPFGESLQRYRIITFHGGRGSGKTYAIAEATVRIMRQTKLRALSAREHLNSIEESSKKEIEMAIERLNLEAQYNITRSYIEHVKTKSSIIFKGLSKNVDSLKSIAGLKWVWGEEMQSAQQETLQKLLPSIRTPGNRIVFSMNPEEDDSFIYQEFVAKAGQPGYEDRLAIEVNYYDNPYFTESLESDRRNALQRILDAPNEDSRQQAIADYEWIWLGHTKKITGAAVLKRWEVREFEAPEDVEFRHGADWSNGGADPTAGVRCFIAKNERGQNCLWVDYEVYIRNGRVDELPEAFDAIPSLNRNSRRGLMSWTLRGDSSLPVAINKMKDSGFSCEPAIKGPGSVENGISFLNNFDRIYIHPRCIDTIREAKLYKWKKDKLSGKILPILIDADNHTIDALRYSVEDLYHDKEVVGFFDVPYGGPCYQWNDLFKKFERSSNIIDTNTSQLASGWF